MTLTMSRWLHKVSCHFARMDVHRSFRVFWDFCTHTSHAMKRLLSCRNFLCARSRLAGVLLFLLCCGSVWPGGARVAGRVAIVAEDGALGQQTRHALVEALNSRGLTGVSWNAADLVPGKAAELGKYDLVVTLGAAALRQTLLSGGGRPIVAMLVSRAVLEAELAKFPHRPVRDVHAIVLDQPTGRYLDLIRIALPQHRRIGLLLGRAAHGPTVALERGAAERGLALNVVRIQGELSIVPQLEQLLSRSEVLLALPDAEVHHRGSVQPLLLTTYRANVPVVAYSEAYVRAGALLALYSTPAQMAQQAAAVAQQLVQGRSVRKIQEPEDFSVSVNDLVARSLGLVIPSAETLRARLQALQGALTLAVPAEGAN